jgi:cellulose synthase (UDP-forming)
MIHTSRRLFLPIIGKTRPELSAAITRQQLVLFRICAVLFIAAGICYLIWRYNQSQHAAYLFYFYVVWYTECLLFLGAVLRIVNYWSPADTPRQNSVHMVSEIRVLQDGEKDRPVLIDVFIATINEEAFILEETINESKRMFYPHRDVRISIYVLDDGQRDGRDADKENIKLLAQTCGVQYIGRENNQGFKAGNLNHAILKTDGDLFVILDADTRPFSRFLYNTTGYFRNHKTAWVQTPQWFKDITEETDLKIHLTGIAGKMGARMAHFIAFFHKDVKAGKDIFCSNPNVFYDVVLRRRNAYNAVFSCGAGSLMRRESVMTHAQKNPGTDKGTPFRHHISEDIFNSLLMHADKEHKWESVYHPGVECSMLSPQDLSSWIKQQQRYAMGSIDIGLSRYNPLWLKGLSLMQRISYFTVFYSYITPLLSVILFMTPIIYFFTQITPFDVSINFIVYFLLIHLLNITVFKIGNIAHSTRRFDQKFWASFSYMYASWLTVIRTRKLPFNVTPKKRNRQQNHWKHTLPQAGIIILTATGILYQILRLIAGYKVDVASTALFLLLGMYHIYQLNTFVRAAFWKPDNE